MSGVSITNLDPASTLTGSEIVPIVQSGTTVRTTLANLGPVGSFTQSGTNAQTTTVQAKLRETVSVMDFGAVGDGNTDDSPAFQKAYDALILSGQGGTIYAPATKQGYRLSTALNFTNSQISIILKGDGGTNVPDLPLTGDSAYGTVLWGNTGNVVIDISARANFGLENLTIDTNNSTKCPNPSRIGVLGGRISTYSPNQNHHFTNVAIFMKSTGSATSPSISHYAYGTELGTYINCWYTADIPAVYNLAPFYNVTSPYVTLASTGTSATCNTMTGCRYNSLGFGPAVHMDGTYDNSFVSSYFYNNKGSATTYPAIKLTGYTHSLNVDTFQCEEFDVCIEINGSLFSSKIKGFTTSSFFDASKYIGFINGSTFCVDNIFEIETGGIGYAYAAYAGTLGVNSVFVNNTFQLNQSGNFNLTAGATNTINNLNFNKWTDEADIIISNHSNIVSCTLNNNQFFTNALKSQKVFPILKSALPNNTANYIFSVTIPNKNIAGSYLFNYTLNSSSNQLVKSGQIHVTVARVANSTAVLSVSESIAQQSAQAAGAETIAVTFLWSGVFDPATGTQYAFMTCTQNSSTSGTAYIRGTIEGFSSFLDNTGLDANKIVIGSV